MLEFLDPLDKSDGYFFIRYTNIIDYVCIVNFVYYNLLY